MSHPSQSCSQRFPEDQVLRDHGFRIHSRKLRVPIWERGGELFGQPRAWAVAIEEERAAIAGLLDDATEFVPEENAGLPPEPSAE